jgi:hypothetical protein
MSNINKHSGVLPLFKYTILATIGICVVGAILNEGRVYGRYRSATCSGGVFELSTPGSELCCSGYHADDWVCLGSRDALERALTRGAWLLPLVPLAIRIIFCLAQSGVYHNLSLFKRIGFYLTMFSYRTVRVLFSSSPYSAIIYVTKFSL